MKGVKIYGGRHKHKIKDNFKIQALRMMKSVLHLNIAKNATEYFIHLQGCASICVYYCLSVSKPKDT